MSTYRKEKNLIIISLDGVNGEYKLDINTGVYYGLRGNPIKTVNRRIEIYRMFWNIPCTTNLIYILRHLFDNGVNFATSHYLELARIAEKLDAVGVPAKGWNTTQFQFLEAHLKEFVAWKKAHPEDFDYCEFREAIIFNEAKKKYGSLLDGVEYDMFRRLNDYITNIT